MNFEKELKPKEETEETKKDVLEEAIEGKGKTMKDFEEQKRLEEEERRKTHPEEFPEEKKED